MPPKNHQKLKNSRLKEAEERKKGQRTDGMNRKQTARWGIKTQPYQNRVILA